MNDNSPDLIPRHTTCYTISDFETIYSSNNSEDDQINFCDVILSEELLDDESFVTKHILQFYMPDISPISDRLRDDFEFMYGAIKKVEELDYLVPYISDRLRDNDVIMYETCKKFDQAICYASERLQNRKSFIINVMAKNGRIFEYIQYSFRNDKTCFMAARQSNQNFNIYKYLGDDLKNDKEVFLDCVRREEYQYMLPIFHWRLRSDLKVCLEATTIDPNVPLKFFCDSLRDNEQVALSCARQSGYNFQQLSHRLRGKEKIVMEFLRVNSHCLQFATAKIRNDRIFAENLCSTIPEALFQMDTSIVNDCELWALALQTQPDLWDVMPSYLQKYMKGLTCEQFIKQYQPCKNIKG